MGEVTKYTHEALRRALIQVGPDAIRSADDIVTNNNMIQTVNGRDVNVPQNTYVTGLTGIYNGTIKFKKDEKDDKVVKHTNARWTIRLDYDPRPEREKGYHINVTITSREGTTRYAWVYRSSLNRNPDGRVSVNGNGYTEDIVRFSQTVHWDIRRRQEARGYNREDVKNQIINEWFRAAFDESPF